MNDEYYWTIKAMDEYGGSFVKALANLYRHADPINAPRIRTVWSGYWSKYTRIGEQLKQQHEKNNA